MSAARSIVAKLRTLAADPENRLTIVRDQGCLPGLILFLDNPDAEVVRMALEALEYLSLCEANRTAIETECGLMVSLEAIIQGGKLPDKAIALRIQQNVRQNQAAAPKARAPLSAVNSNSLPGASAAAAEFSSETSSSLSSSSHSAGGAVKRSGFFAQSGSNKRANVVTFQLNCLDDSQCRSLVEEALLEVIGVISFTFDLKQDRVFVRTKPNVEVADLFRVILSVSDEIDVKQVIRENNGTETLVAPTVNKTDPNFEPDYLEDQYPIEETSKTAVTRFGETQEKSSGWFGGITSYLSKSIWG